MKNPLELFSSVVSNVSISNDRVDLLSYSRDMWPKGQLQSFDGTFMKLPEAIIWPSSNIEVSEILKICAKYNISVIPFGAGSGVCGGTVVLEPSIIIDVKKLNKIYEINKHECTVDVGVGIIGEHLERKLNLSGFTLGHFPSSIYCSSLGGYIAARSAGQFSSYYGKMEDMITGLEFITGSGEIIYFSDVDDINSVFDISKIIIGSEGTMGIITRAKLRIHHKTNRIILRGFHFSDISKSMIAMREIMRSNLRPSVMRLYDELDTIIAGKGGEDEVNYEENFVDIFVQKFSKYIPKLKSLAINRVLRKPSILNHAVSLLHTGCMMIVGFEGDDSIAEDDMNYTKYIFSKLDAKYLGESPGLHWLKNRYSVSYKQSSLYKAGAFVDTMEVATTWDNLENLYYSVKKAVSKYVFIMAHFSHAYPGGCSIYFTFAGSDDQGNKIQNLYKKVWNVALEAVYQSNSTITHHHGVGLSKAHYLPKEFGEGMYLIKAAKTIFDPSSIMNNGKIGL